MHSLTSYQAAAVANAENLTASRLTNNLLTATGNICMQVLDREDSTTQPLRSHAALQRDFADTEAAIGALLFNAAVLADRFGIDLAELAEAQLEKVERITNSGRLRMLAGGKS